MKLFWLLFAGLLGQCMQVLSMDNSRFFRYKRPITALAASDDGVLCVAGFAQGTVVLQNIEKNECVQYDGLDSSVTSLAVGNYVVIGYECGNLSVLDTKMRELQNLNGHSGAIGKMALDGNTLITVSGSDVKVWNIASGDLITEKNFTAPVGAVSVSEFNGFCFVAIGCDVYCLKLESNDLVAEFHGHEMPVVALVSKGSILVSGSSDGVVCLSDTISGSVKKIDVVSGLQLLGASNCVLLAFSGDTCRAYNWSGTLLDSAQLLLSDSQIVATGGNRVFCGDSAGNFCIKRLADYKVPVSLYNFTDRQVENISIFDYYKCCCNKPVSCESYGHVQSRISCLDALRNGFLRFTYGDKTLCYTLKGLLVGLREVAIAFDIVSGDLVLQAEHCPVGGERKEPQFFSYAWKKFPAYMADRCLKLPIYTIGKAFKSIILSNNKGEEFVAKKDKALGSLWKVKVLHPLAPRAETHYDFRATTDNATYRWQVPFLCEQTELLLSVPQLSDQQEKAYVRSKKERLVNSCEHGRAGLFAPMQGASSFMEPFLVLYTEFPCQRYQVPLLSVTPNGERVMSGACISPSSCQ